MPKHLTQEQQAALKDHDFRVDAWTPHPGEATYRGSVLNPDGKRWAMSISGGTAAEAYAHLAYVALVHLGMAT